MLPPNHDPAPPGTSGSFGSRHLQSNPCRAPQYQRRVAVASCATQANGLVPRRRERSPRRHRLKTAGAVPADKRRASVGARSQPHAAGGGDCTGTLRSTTRSTAENNARRKLMHGSKRAPARVAELSSGEVERPLLASAQL
eukprot:6996314-Prymnesium_polylepis.2